MTPEDKPPSNEAVMLPNHYGRWKIEPQYFITVNELDKGRGDIIKRIMRWDAKDGLIDLYKAMRDLEIYTTFQEEKLERKDPLSMQFHKVPTLLDAVKRYVRRNELKPSPLEWWSLACFAKLQEVEAANAFFGALSGEKATNE